MHFNKSNTHSWLSKALLLLVYVSFFIVQIFFNLNSNVNSSLNGYSKNHLTSSHQFNFCTSKTGKHKSGAPKIRLNKRFEPNVMQVTDLDTLVSPVYYKIVTCFASYKRIKTPGAFLHSQSFRGPPVVC